MKSNRTNNYTTGVCDIIDNDRNKRFCFFEIDVLGDPQLYFRICECYKTFNLDYIVHRTHLGWHWLSPTIVDLITWKAFHRTLEDVNKKCPMTCLRVEPNKYPNEDLVWYLHYYGIRGLQLNNCIEMCDYLNHIWHGEQRFNGVIHGKIKIVRYPLPLVRI